jgi:hypothetical protein
MYCRQQAQATPESVLSVFSQTPGPDGHSAGSPGQRGWGDLKLNMLFKKDTPARFSFVF